MRSKTKYIYSQIYPSVDYVFYNLTALPLSIKTLKNTCEGDQNKITGSKTFLKMNSFKDVFQTF